MYLSLLVNVLVLKLVHATPLFLYWFRKSEQAFTSTLQNVDMSYKCYEDEYKYLNPLYAQFLPVGPQKVHLYMFPHVTSNNYAIQHYYYTLT